VAQAEEVRFGRGGLRPVCRLRNEMPPKDKKSASSTVTKLREHRANLDRLLDRKSSVINAEINQRGLLKDKISAVDRMIDIGSILDKHGSHDEEEVFGKTCTSILVFDPAVRGMINHAEHYMQHTVDHDLALGFYGDTVASSCASLDRIVLGRQDIFNDSHISRINADVYRQRNISYIKEYLGENFSLIKKEFDEWLAKFDGIGSHISKYQEFIGLRTLFFYKLIFDGSVNKGRKAQIEEFVTGGMILSSLDRPIVDNTHELYRELSQDDRENSVKMGRISELYVQELFDRVLITIANLFKLREKYCLR
jgi:hypothetical protein